MILLTNQIFQDGKLIKTQYINYATGIQLPDNYIISSTDTILRNTAQWASFIKDMFVDSAYNEIVNNFSTSTRIITRLETACTVYLSNTSSSPELIIQFFNELINSLEYTLSAETISKWNKIALKNSMDIFFDNHGVIQRL